MAENYYEWSDIESFENWHNQIKTQLGLPKPSFNQLTGELDEDAEWTTDYTNPIILSDCVIAKVENEYAKGLTITNKRPPTHNLFFTK